MSVFRIIENPRMTEAHWLPMWQTVVMPSGLSRGGQVALLHRLATKHCKRRERLPIEVGIREGFRALIASSGSSISEVARRASVPRSTLSRRIERGSAYLPEIVALGELAGLPPSGVVAVMELYR